MTWQKQPANSGPPACCRGLAMAFAGYTMARGTTPPAEVESSVWRCGLCGATWARPVRAKVPSDFVQQRAGYEGEGAA